MTVSRRMFLAGAAATALPVPAMAYTRSEIDASVASAIQLLRESVGDAAKLMAESAGYLIMADVKKAGFLVGGEYGEGQLFVGGAPVAYYSVAGASFGLQAGIQRSNQALFFMTEDALRDFRMADGWTAGADVAVAVPDAGAGAAISSNTANRPVVAIIYGREGLMAGASIAGAKYSRIQR